MSRELTSSERIKHVLRWSINESIASVVICLIIISYAILINAGLLDTVLEPVESIINERLDGIILTVTEWLTKYSFMSTALVALFWAFVGALIYMIYWIVSTSAHDASWAFSDMFKSHHPNDWSYFKSLTTTFLDRMVFFSAALGVVLYGSIWTNIIVRNLVIEIINSVNKGFTSDLVLLIPYLMIIIVSMHGMIIPFRVMKGEHKKRYAPHARS